MNPTELLKQALQDADEGEYNREPLTEIYDLYIRNIDQTKGYVELSVSRIMADTNLPDSLRYKVEHEVYLSGGHRRKLIKDERVRGYAGEGYLDASTALVHDGGRYDLIVESDGIFGLATTEVKRTRCCVVEGGVFFLPPRNSRWGYQVGGSKDIYARVAA